jgi:predicted MFS family arabinose efflux permease
MSDLVIYLFPAAIDMALASVLFMTTVWAAQRGVSASGVSNLLTTWAAAYMVCAFAVGRVVNTHNAARLLIAACLATAALAAAFMAASSLHALYILIALEGAAMAVFFTPFQVFMKLVGQRKRRSITASVGLYTCSWSTGFALGPFVAGFLWDRLGWAGCHAINAAAALLVAAAIYLIHRRIRNAPHPQQTDTPAPLTGSNVADYSLKPDLAWMSWLFGGVGCVVVAVIRSIFPTSGAACDIPKFEQGLILCILSAVQAIVGLTLSRGRWWMYRPLPILGFGLCGVVAMTLFALSTTPAGFLLAAVCFGIYSGSFFYYFVFHSLVHPEHAGRYVSINEAVVGLASIIGPFAGGLLADRWSLSTPYLAAASIVLAAILIQSLIHARLQSPAATLQPHA